MMFYYSTGLHVSQYPFGSYTARFLRILSPVTLEARFPELSVRTYCVRDVCTDFFRGADFVPYAVPNPEPIIPSPGRRMEPTAPRRCQSLPTPNRTREILHRLQRSPLLFRQQLAPRIFPFETPGRFSFYPKKKSSRTRAKERRRSSRLRFGADLSVFPGSPCGREQR